MSLRHSGGRLLDPLGTDLAFIVLAILIPLDLVHRNSPSGFPQFGIVQGLRFQHFRALGQGTMAQQTMIKLNPEAAKPAAPKA